MIGYRLLTLTCCTHAQCSVLPCVESYELIGYPVPSLANHGSQTQTPKRCINILGLVDVCTLLMRDD